LVNDRVTVDVLVSLTLSFLPTEEPGTTGDQDVETAVAPH
jgi:hypothetical protein